MADESDINAQVASIVGSQNSPVGATSQGKLDLPVGKLAKVAGLFKDIAKMAKDLLRDLPKVADEIGSMAEASGGLAGRGGVRFRSRITGATDGVAQGLSSIAQARLTRGDTKGAIAAGIGSSIGGMRGAAVAAAVDTAMKLPGQLMGRIDQRIDQAANYALTADRMSVLYQQLTGMSQVQVQNKFRQPLTNYRLGMGGINTLLGLQASTGINAALQAPSVEALRAISGYSLGTSDVAGMLAALGRPETVNRMFMMTGQSLYGFGGRQRSAMSVVQNLTNMAGLTNKAVVESAFQQGSVSRERLRQMGVPEDMIDTVLQYARENITYREKGGRGMYNPSIKKQRELMGFEGNFAPQAEETERLMTSREERFYSRQADNYASLERSTQKLIRAFGALEDRLSGLIGARISTRPLQRKAGSALSTGAKWAAMGAGLGAMSATPFGPAVGAAVGGLLGLGAGYLGLGDPGGDAGQVPPSYTSGIGADPPSGPISEADRKYAKNLPNNPALNGLDPAFKQRLIAMIQANPRIKLGGGKRSEAAQWKMFFGRYRKTDLTKAEYDRMPTSKKYWYRYYDGKSKTPSGEEEKPAGVYEKISKSGYPAAPPGFSLHQYGFAYDLHYTNNAKDAAWVLKNAPRFGLVMPDPKNDNVHVQPLGLTGASDRKGRVSWMGSSGSPNESGIIGKPSLNAIKKQLKALNIDTSNLDLDAILANLNAMDAGTGFTGVDGGGSDIGQDGTPSSWSSDTAAPASGSVMGGAGGSSSQAGPLVYSNMSIDDIIKYIQSHRSSKFSNKYGSRQAISTTTGSEGLGDAYMPSMSSVGSPQMSSVGTATTSQSSGPVIYQIAPNIYVGNANDVSGTDLQKMAREVGRLLEHEVRTKALRRK